MEPPLTGNSSTPKPSLSSPTTSRAGLSLANSSSTTTTPTSDQPSPKLTMPTSPTTPTSTNCSASRQTFPGLSSRSSSLSTLSSSPLRQPIRSLSQVGRSQLNATSIGNPISPLNSASGAATTAPKTPPTPEPGERLLVFCSFNRKTQSSPTLSRTVSAASCHSLLVLWHLHDNCIYLPQYVKQPLLFY